MAKFLSKDEVIKRIKENGGTVYLTIGFRWKNPTTMDKPLTAEEAIKFVQSSGLFMEINDRKDGKFHLDTYTANDMW